jgi:hypothetical protein
MKRFTLITAAIFAASSASAQDMNFGLSDYQVGAGLSSLGAYVEGSGAVASNLRVRGTVYRAGYEDDVEIDESDIKSDIDADFDATSAHLMGDYYLGGLGFRLSGGLSVGGYELNGATEEATLGGDRFFNSDGSEFTLGIKQKSNVAPVAAVGYARSFGAKKQWGVSAEVGTRFATFEITPSSIDNITSDNANAAIARINQAVDDARTAALALPAGPARDAALAAVATQEADAVTQVANERQSAKDEFNSELKKINDDLADFGLVPFLSVGVTFNF